MKRIFISAGHGGKDPGATAHGTTEFDICSRIAKELVKKLRENSIESVLVPLGLTLRDRIKWVNANTNAEDFLVELHMNAGPAQATGAEGYFFTGSKLSEDLCMRFTQLYTNSIDLRFRKVAGDTTTRHGRLGIIRDTAPMALLMELGFITNVHDLNTVREQAVGALYTSCVDLVGVEPPKAPISEWAKASVDKAIKKNIAVYWENPQEIVASQVVEHMFKNLGIFNHATGTGITKERFVVALDRLGLLD